MFRKKLRHWLFRYLDTINNGWMQQVVLCSDKKSAEELFLAYCKENNIDLRLYVGYKCSYGWFVRKALTREFPA